MQYVNCLYTTQGDYVCQKNENLDSFYNKHVVDESANNTVSISDSVSASVPASVTEYFYAGEAAKDEARKVAMQIKECTVPNMQSSDARKKELAMKTCTGAMTNAYHNYCNTNQVNRCYYTAPPATRGRVFATCDGELKSQIDNAINSVVSGQETDVTKLFTCRTPPQ